LINSNLGLVENKGLGIEQLKL